MKVFLIMLLMLTLNAKVLISPVDAMKYCYGFKSEISKKNILLSTKQVKEIQKKAKVRVKSKIFRVFTAKKGKEIIGYGILLNRKVRSKNGATLYMISKNSKLKGIEIIAFNEPMEYIPSNRWLSQFSGLSTSKEPRVGKDISTITGATLSARAITDGARLAFALYDTVLKEK